jgi:CRISPR-associated protein Cas5h
MIKKFIIFDIWGDYGHFKKYYTTSSPLTFSIPPRTAIIGLISAIIGLEKNRYLSLMTKDKADVAIRIINPVKKIRISQNLINTKDGFWIPIKKGAHEPRTQVRFEYLKEPRFRIYFTHSDDKIYNSLKENLKNHKSVYTPCLGLSELIADFEFVDEVSVARNFNNENFIDIHSVIPFDTMREIDLLVSNRKYFKERIPVEMYPGRIVTEYREVIYEINGNTIRAKVENTLILSNNDAIVIL